MKKKEVSSISAYSNKNFSRSINPFIHHRQDKKRSLISTLFDKPNNSNDSIINNSNNEIIDIDDDDFEDENFFGNTTGHHFLTPINETHRFLSSKNKFGKINVNSLNSKKIPIPKSKSKSPNIRNIGNTRNKSQLKISQNDINNKSTEKNEIFSFGNDFLHCRNCMLIIGANGDYSKYYFNK